MSKPEAEGRIAPSYALIFAEKGGPGAILEAAMKQTKHLATGAKGGGEAAVLERIEEIGLNAADRDPALRLGIGDDAALFRPTVGSETILTCDWSLEGTHFLRNKHAPDSVGWKCLARAVSDVAAMGGISRCFLLSLALPSAHTGAWLNQFLGGLRRAAQHFGCSLAGGDTTRRQEILINVTVIGEVRAGGALLRSRARPGDVLFVSGRLGEAQLGLQLILGSKRRLNSRDPVLRKHLYPEPRLALGRWLAEKRLASAMMDLSDGLSTDLPRLCVASGVGARVHSGQIPAPKANGRAGRTSENPLELALHGGDDYELLFTVPKRNLKNLPHSFKGIPLTAIGAITKEPAVLFVDPTGREVPLPNRGWDPFRNHR